MHVNGGDSSSRNKLLALAALHGWLHVRARLRSLVLYLSGRTSAWAWLMKMAYWQTIVSVLIVASACVYISCRIYSRLRSLLSTTTEIKTPCASGCDKCISSRDGCGYRSIPACATEFEKLVISWTTSENQASELIEAGSEQAHVQLEHHNGPERGRESFASFRSYGSSI